MHAHVLMHLEATRPGTCRPVAPGRPAAARHACSSRSGPRARPARAAAPRSVGARRTAGRRPRCAAPPYRHRARRARCAPPAQVQMQVAQIGRGRKWQARHNTVPGPVRLPAGARLHARRRVAVGGHQRGATAHVEQRRVLGRHGLRGRTTPHLGNPARPGSTAAPDASLWNL